MESEEASSPVSGGRRPFVPTRSTASNNWRLKDDSPRAEQPSQRRTDNGHRLPRRDDDNGYDNHTGSPRFNTYSRQPRESSDVPTEVTTPRLYVGNLLYSAQPSDVENFFIANGFKPTNLSMSIDPMSGRNPSYCFVDLESVDDAKQAIEELNGKDVLGRAVRINPGVAKKDGGLGPAGRDGLKTRTFEGGRSHWRDAGADGEQTPSKPTYNRWKSGDGSSPQWSRPQQDQGKRLYVGGLPHIDPQSQVDAAIQNLFSGFEISTISKLISPHPSKTTEPGDHHYLFVDLVNIEDVDAAIEALNDSVSPFSENGQGRLKVNKARDNQSRRPPRDQDDRPSQGQSFGKSSWRDQ